MKTERVFAAAGALMAAISVIAGAFGAHVMKGRLLPELLNIFETGARYQIYHALALLGACPSIRRGRVPGVAWADARRRDAGDAGTSSRSGNAADARATLGPEGRMGVARLLLILGGS